MVYGVVAPLLVSLGSLGTIYEGVSFFISGGNMVAIDFMLGNVSNIRRQMRLWKRSQGYRYRDFNRQMWVIESGIKYEPIYKDVEFEMKKKLRSI